MFKCVQDPIGIECWVCIAVESCQENPRWFPKKVDLKAHLLKEHNSKTVLRRGLKILEEEEALEGGPKYFNDYKRERSSKEFFNTDLKYNTNRARLSHLRNTMQSLKNSEPPLVRSQRVRKQPRPVADSSFARAYNGLYDRIVALLNLSICFRVIRCCEGQFYA